MTPVSVPQARLAHERRSAIVTLLLLLVCLLLGWWVKTAVQNATRQVEIGGFSAAVPDGWLVQEGAGELVFIVRNPQSLDQLYRVTHLPPVTDLAALAESRSQTRAHLDASYRVLEAAPIVFGGQDAYKVSFARVDLAAPGLPGVIEGVDYYFVQNNQVVALSLESHSDTLDDALPTFHKFVQSVTYNAGE